MESITKFLLCAHLKQTTQETQATVPSGLQAVERWIRKCSTSPFDSLVCLLITEQVGVCPKPLLTVNNQSGAGWICWEMLSSVCEARVVKINVDRHNCGGKKMFQSMLSLCTFR